MTWMCNAAMATGLTLAMTTSVLAQSQQQPADALVDWPMDRSPTLEMAEAPRAYHPRLMALWMQALAQPDALTRYQAATTVAEAARQGMPGLEATLERLAVMLTDEKEHVLARQAAAEAIIALDGSAHAQALHDAAQQIGQDMTLLVDPALARWKHGASVALWRQRLADGSQGRVVRLSSIRALAIAQDRASAEALRMLALKEGEHPAVRLAAAQAYAKLAPGGGAQAVPSLPSRADALQALVNAWLLAGHDDADRLVQVAANPHEPAVAAVAAHRLMALAPARLDALLAEYGQSGDAGLRRIAIDRQAALKQPAAVASLGRSLADVDPDLRVLARDHLIALSADAALRASVHDALRRAVASDQPRAIEQAALAIGQVGPDDTADTLIAHLDHADKAVGLSAATALRQRSLPATLPAALASMRKYAFIKEGDAMRDAQAAQLIQLLGEHRQAEALPDLRKLVPKGSGGMSTRQAAIWAMGMILEGKPDDGLVRQLLARVRDTMSMEPEDDGVRRQALVAMGRMKVQGQLAALSEISRTEDTAPTGMAARWAIGQVTGQQPPEPTPKPQYVTGWFLEPLD